jgi:hypothetical protein
MYRSKKKTSLSANDLDVLIQKMADNWPSEVVARTKIEEFTGGLITGKTMANLDSQGEGPPRVKCSRKTGYPKNPLCDWLRQRMTEER